MNKRQLSPDNFVKRSQSDKVTARDQSPPVAPRTTLRFGLGQGSNRPTALKLQSLPRSLTGGHGEIVSMKPCAEVGTPRLGLVTWTIGTSDVL